MSYDTDVAAATTGGDTNWDKIIKLCDRIRESFGSAAMGAALGAVMRRVKHSDPLVQWQALTLLEACVSNCGKDFQLEMTKSPFHSQVKDILTSRTVDPRSVQKLKTLLATWAMDYRGNSLMSGFNNFVDQLIRDGLIVLQGGSSGSVPSSMHSSVSPPQRSQEDDDLQKAIRLSLEEAQSQTAPSMYPTFSESPPTHNPISSSSNLTSFNVRAIYDFEAVEDNELTFKAGEVITVIDNSDENWWRGKTQLGTGLFPANFVSPDLSASPEPVRGEQKATTTATTNGATGGGGGGEKKVTEVNEAQVDVLLDMLKTADITSDNPEELKTLNDLEAECKAMKLIAESNIEEYEKQLNDMNEVSEKLQQALSTYRRLLQEKPRLSYKAPPISEPQPPPYQYSNTENTEDYYDPPPPSITGTFHSGYNIGGGYNPPYAGPGMSYAPPTNLTQGAGGYAPPPPPPPTEMATLPSLSSYLPSLQQQQMSQVAPPPPPPQPQFSSYDAPSYAAPQDIPQHYIPSQPPDPNRSPQMMHHHHQVAGGGGHNNSLWMSPPQPQPLL